MDDLKTKLQRAADKSPPLTKLLEMFPEVTDMNTGEHFDKEETDKFLDGYLKLTFLKSKTKTKFNNMKNQNLRQQKPQQPQPKPGAARFTPPAPQQQQQPEEIEGFEMEEVPPQQNLKIWKFTERPRCEGTLKGWGTVTFSASDRQELRVITTMEESDGEGGFEEVDYFLPNNVNLKNRVAQLPEHTMVIIDLTGTRKEGARTIHDFKVYIVKPKA